MIAVVDYGVGNLFSLTCSLRSLGAEVLVTGDADAIRRADRVVLPGVGAFGDAADRLRRSGLDRPVREAAEAGRPLLGICLGMQLLLERSFEYGEHRGLGLIPGDVVPVAPAVPAGYKVPHIGWNALRFPKNKPVSPLFRYSKEGDCVYFVHSYYASCPAAFVTASAEYGAELTAAVGRGNVQGVQFHPEKSGAVGLGILRAFCEMEVGG